MFFAYNWFQIFTLFRAMFAILCHVDNGSVYVGEPDVLTQIRHSC